MPLTVNTNTSATTASFQLSAANAALRKSFGRLSSGNRIGSPAEDAGGLSVASKLQSRLTRVERVGENLQNSISFLQVQEGALQVAGNVITRVSELKTIRMPQRSFFSSFRKKPAKAAKAPKAFAYIPI